MKIAAAAGGADGRLRQRLEIGPEIHAIATGRAQPLAISFEVDRQHDQALVDQGRRQIEVTLTNAAFLREQDDQPHRIPLRQLNGNIDQPLGGNADLAWDGPCPVANAAPGQSRQR